VKRYSTDMVIFFCSEKHYHVVSLVGT